MIKGIVFTEPKKACFTEVPEPLMKPHYVLVKLERSTVSSGTERANLLGVDRVSTLDEQPGFPRRIGYSSSGIIVDKGEDVKDLKIGDRVCASWTTHSQLCALNTDKVTLLDDSISFGEGALVHIATFPMAAIRKTALEMGESAIVMGMGILGLIAVKLLRVAGACPIIAVDPDPEKRRIALEYGADYAFDPYEEGFAQSVMAVTGKGARVGIEVTGIGKGLNGILECMAKMGRVALLGCTRNSDFTVDYYGKVHGRGISLIGAHTLARPKSESSHGLWTDADDREAVCKLIKGKRLDLGSMIEEVRSPEEASEVYTRLANEKTFPVLQFDWSKVK